VCLRHVAVSIVLFVLAQSLREKMERMNVGLKRSQDDSPTIRDLLCVILQLVQGDPQVFLHVRFFFN